MYLVYESLYGELLYECESTFIVGLYDSKEKAINKVKELIEQDLKDNWVLDEERKDLENDNHIRLFYNNQENWNDYFEILIKKVELNKDFISINKD